MFWSKRNIINQRAHALYHNLVQQARLSVFYQNYGVPDTLAGHLEVIWLHLFLLYYRLKEVQHDDPLFKALRELGQELYDVAFGDFDMNLREMGVGDLSVGRWIKGLARKFHYRIAAYEQALTNQSGWPEVLGQTLYSETVPQSHHIDKIVSYIHAAHQTLSRLKPSELWEGNFRWQPLE